ncbi:MAG: YfhL family 4Fe-4S dicluster ferredoxin [Firmicutes bacterium]|nr:YfhL family 4Fe-4S dicluster ferredoxin [Bacillota bacterium]
MAVRITEECVSCGACEPTCPNDAISPGDDFYRVDPERCTECLGFYGDQQCVGVCPTDAIVADDDHRESKDDLLAKYRRLHPDRPPEKLDSWQPAR